MPPPVRLAPSSLSRSTAAAALPLWIAAAGFALGTDTLRAQPSPLRAADAFRPASEARCTSSAALLSPGGGVIRLEAGGAFRVPYGVAYEFRRRVGGAEWVVLELRVAGADPQTVLATAAAGDPTCFRQQLPRLPVDETVTLVERDVLRAPRQQVDDALAALDRFLESFIRRAFSGAWVGQLGGPAGLRDAVRNDLPTLLDRHAFSDLFLVTRTETGLDRTPLADRIDSLVVRHAAEISRVFVDLNAIQTAHEVLDDARTGSGVCTAAGQLSPARRQLLDDLVRRSRPVHAARSQADVGRLYARGTLEPGVYRVLFRDSDDGDRVLGGFEADLTGPDGTCAVACDHGEDEDSDVFQRNVRACLVVEDEETCRAPVPLCLRGA